MGIMYSVPLIDRIMIVYGFPSMSHVSFGQMDSKLNLNTEVTGISFAVLLI